MKSASHIAARRLWSKISVVGGPYRFVGLNAKPGTKPMTTIPTATAPITT